jgi:hypothetical protein
MGKAFIMEGSAARSTGRSVRENPYGVGTEERGLWLQGWLLAALARKDRLRS